MIFVPIDTPDVEIERNLPKLNHHTPEGHCEILFRNVKVPTENHVGHGRGGFHNMPNSFGQAAFITACALLVRLNWHWS